VSFETSFDSKQPKLEPKLVSALSETKRLFQLFRFCTETESFDVSIERKQTKDQPKQFDREHILQFFTENLWFFRFFRFISFFFLSFFGFFLGFSVCFETLCFGVSVVSLLYRNREFRLIRNKQKTHPNSLKESIFGYFSENLGLFRFVTKQFCLFRLFRYRFEKPKQTETFCFWFHETNRNKRETDLFWVCFGSNRKLFLFVSRTP
jgi:hypothetical protein